MSEPYYGWAVDAIEGLNWLVDLDDWAFHGTRENLKGRDPEVIDVVHVRWAASTAVTALNLCGVELAVRYGALDFWTKNAPVLNDVEKVVTNASGELPQWASKWLKEVLRDRGYQTLKKTRDPLIHRFLVRSALLWTTVPTEHQSRTEFDVPNPERMDTRPSARQLIVLARDVADRHVRAFGAALQRNRIP
jgi:hypothetical protein